MSSQKSVRRMRSGAVQLSAVSVLSLTLVACSSSSTRATCVDGQTRGYSGYRVVPDYYCDNGGSYGRYFWYYGGRSRSGYLYHGTTIRPRGGRIVSRGGRVISRGGFGGHHSTSHFSRGG
jgi:hypothetical protein